MVHDGKLFFTADDGVHGRELWVTDGTGGNTALFKDIYPGGVGSGVGSFTLLNNVLYCYRR